MPNKVDRREEIARRAAGCCEYCLSQEKYSPTKFSVEHILTKKRGNAADDLALSCQECNNHKYIKTSAPDPVSGETVPLFHPRKDNWSDHFAWSEDFEIIEGITPIGRATVALLRVNRDRVVNLRRILIKEGKHPPVYPPEIRQEV